MEINVVVEGDVKGIVVCDYDQQECLPGYEDWFTKETLVGGGTLSKGIMVKTNELDFIHSLMKMTIFYLQINNNPRKAERASGSAI